MCNNCRPTFAGTYGCANSFNPTVVWPVVLITISHHLIPVLITDLLSNFFCHTDLEIITVAKEKSILYFLSLMSLLSSLNDDCLSDRIDL